MNTAILFNIAVLLFLIQCDFLENFNGGYLPSAGLNNPKDSLFVRELLDNNGLTTTPASRVMEIQSNRIVRIGLYPKDSTLVLPPIVDSLPKGITIGARGINNVNIPNKLHNPIMLLLNDNSFKNYPSDLFNLADNSYLELSYNQITILPYEIMSFKFKDFGFNYNHICNASDTLSKWLEQWYPNWEKYQTCP
jgi:hypothetical protein